MSKGDTRRPEAKPGSYDEGYERTFLTRKIAEAWGKNTSSTPQEWSRNNPARGQCAVTALIIQDRWGGDLLRSIVNGESHYFNRLPNGEVFDLTLHQFGDNPVISEPVLRTREYVLAFPDTRRRYQFLRERL